MRANASLCRPQAWSGVAVLGLTLLLGGCFGRPSDDVTGSIATATPSTPEAARAATAEWSVKYKANPVDKVAAINYAKALRANTQYNQATAVMETVAMKLPYDRDVLAAYGKALADSGRLKEAADVLSRAHTPENPSWSVLSAQGSVADQMGDHAKAQDYYATALKIRPADPHILSNLGLSYALDHQLDKAETTMAQASAGPGADMRVRQNYALVLALDGKFAEAQRVAERDLSPADAAASVSAIRGMIAQSNTWSAIQQAAAKRKPKAAAHVATGDPPSQP